MDLWLDTCMPCIDPDSLDPTHQGENNIPPFQTHSRYFYAPLGENYCGHHFVDLFYQQHHPFPHCRDCARLVLGAASFLCWQCRTYFRCYGIGTMQNIMWITPQRHNSLEVVVPQRGHNQRRLLEEVASQEWRDVSLRYLTPPILQVLLPQESSCKFWQLVSEVLQQFGNNRCLQDLPTMPMAYFSDEALLPLPPTPEAGFRTGLTLHPELIDDTLPVEEDQDLEPVQE